ncbi:MAG: hypothetical protein K2K19_09650, partial [Acetatifactor sp.]|nr:hypothetical protein [Acetatifactor sp.]
MKRKTAYILIIIFFLSAISFLGGYLFTKTRGDAQPQPQKTIVQDNTPSPVPSSATTLPEDVQPDISVDEPIPFQAVPAVPDSACFTYEELADGTLRITGYDESKNMQNPYQVIIPSMIDGKPVSTLGTQSIQAHKLIELVI